MPSWGWHWRTDLNFARKRSKENGRIWGFEVYVVQEPSAKKARLCVLGKISVWHNYGSEAELMRSMKRDHIGFFGYMGDSFIAIINKRLYRTETHEEAYDMLLARLPSQEGTYK